jgi:DNA-binding MarR family transcriptional regulator
MESIAGQFDLTVQQLFALKHLAGEVPLAMSELATSLGCDASNVTSIVDKLESRGIVTRRSDERDRRVKVLTMTAAGTALQERIESRMQLAPPAIDNLSLQDQHHLCRILERALDSLS